MRISTVILALVWLAAFAATSFTQHPSASTASAVNGSSGSRNVHAKLDTSFLQTSQEWDPDYRADAAAINKFRQRGAFMKCLLAMSDADAGNAWPDPYSRNPPSARSLFPGTLESELATWEWYDSDYDQYENCNFATESERVANRIGKALAALGVNAYHSAIGGHNTCYSVEHYDGDKIDDDPNGEADPEEQAYFVNGKEYRCTGAFYRFGINQADGAIFAQNLMSPWHAAMESWTYLPLTKENMPRLRAGSDIVFAYWLRGNANPKNLKYYFFNHVNNPETMAIIGSIVSEDVPLKENREKMLYWPGLTYGMNTAQGQALLGSPLGITLGYLLLQHKAELGLKTVKDVTIFRDDPKDHTYTVFVQLVFRVIDVPGDVSQAVDDQAEAKSLLRVHRVDVARL